MFFTLSLILLLGLSSVYALPGSACSKAPYNALLVLSAHPPAQSFCTSHFPPPACSSTVTVTATSILSTTTGTTTATITSVSSVDSTATVTLTVATATVSTTTTITSTQNVGLKHKRDAREQIEARAAVPTSGPLARRANPILDTVLSKLASSASSIISTACYCIETQPACQTATSTSTLTMTSAIQATATTTVTITATNTITSTIPATATTVVTATATTVAQFSYSLAFGPANGCAYSPSTFIDQTDFFGATTHEQRVAQCAAFCDAHSNCASFGMNDFPPCSGNGESTYCIISADPYSAGQTECGIGTGYNGCSIYQDGTIYNRV